MKTEEVRINDRDGAFMCEALAIGDVFGAVSVFIKVLNKRDSQWQDDKDLVEMLENVRTKQQLSPKKAWEAINRPDILSGLLSIALQSDELVLEATNSLVGLAIGPDTPYADRRFLRDNALPILLELRGTFSHKEKRTDALLERLKVLNEASVSVMEEATGMRANAGDKPKDVADLTQQGGLAIGGRWAAACQAYMQSLVAVTGDKDEDKKLDEYSEHSATLRSLMVDICYGVTLMETGRLHMTNGFASVSSEGKTNGQLAAERVNALMHKAVPFELLRLTGNHASGSA